MTFNITLTETHVYIAIIVFLLLLQIRQQYVIQKLQQEVKQTWTQLAAIWFVLSAKAGDPKQQIQQDETKN